MKASAVTGLASRLLTHEAGDATAQDRQAAEGASPLPAPAERAFEKLRAHLSRRVGVEGYRTLISRALSLATPLYPSLGAVRIGQDARVEALPPDTRNAAAAEEANTAVTALLEQLLGLLVTFIGNDLTLRMVRTVWPDFPLENGSAAGPLDEEKL